MRLFALSFHDFRGDVLYLSEGVLGPDEHEIVGEAVTRFSTPETPDTCFWDLTGGRTAIALAARQGSHGFCGLLFMIVDTKRFDHKARTSIRRTTHTLIKRFAHSLDLPPSVVAPTDSPTARLRRLALNPSEAVTPELEQLESTIRRMPFELHLQRLMPIIYNQAPARYEVLLRSETSGLPGEAPHDLINSATDHGLGSIIDRRVLISLTGWLRQHKTPLVAEGGMLSVNLTVTSLHDIHFGRFLKRILRAAALPRSLIAIELDAEHCLLHRGAASSMCASLEQLGCPIVLDNFEPCDRGFDLLRLPGIRVLKLSPSITQLMRTDAVSRAIVSAVVQASRVLGLQTVAKHGNPALDAEWLKALGIDFLQSDSATRPRALSTFGTKKLSVNSSVPTLTPD